MISFIRCAILWVGTGKWLKKNRYSPCSVAENRMPRRRNKLCSLIQRSKSDFVRVVRKHLPTYQWVTCQIKFTEQLRD